MEASSRGDIIEENVENIGVKTDYEELDMDTIDPNFKYEIAGIPGGENILYCFQCGTCSVVCPVGAEDDRYDPRKIIRMALLGMRTEVLSSDFLWLCSACYSCHERCPQNVMITSLVAAIQYIAMKEGYIHSSIDASIDLLDKHGRMVEIDEFDNKMRSKFSLPEIEEKVEETRKILEKTEIKKLTEGD
jgi:heterodisulfide reductase subunit C